MLLEALSKAQRSHVLAIACALSVPFATCFACSGNTPSATVDSGLIDAKPDTSRPKPVVADASIDAKEGIDAGPFVLDRNAFPGEWEQIPNPSPRCGALVATHPERDVSPLTWTACASGRSGCRTLVVDWTPWNVNEGLRVDRHAMRADATGNLYLDHTRQYPNQVRTTTAGKELYVVEKIGSGPVFAQAWVNRADYPDCAPHQVISTKGIVQYVTFFELNEQRYRRATWATPLTLDPTINVSYTESGGLSNVGAVNGASIARATQSSFWSFLDLNTGVLRDETKGLDQATSLEDGFLARNFVTGLPVVRIRNDGSFTTLLTSPPGRSVTAFEVDREQGQQLAWVEARNVAPPSFEPVVYTAPLAASRAELVPRRVTAYDDPGQYGGGYMSVGNGMALILTGPGSAVLVRLSDGRHWVVSPEPGMGFYHALHVSTDEVWLSTATLFSGSTIRFGNNSIMRLRIDSLGPGLSAE
jgi:hypothetical protein